MIAKFELPFHKKRAGDGTHYGVDTTTRRRDPAPRGGMKSHLLAFVPESVGTVLFLWFAFAIHQMAIDPTGVLAQNGVGLLSGQTVVIIALGYGFSYLVTV
jgi:aquaporin related protein